MTEEKALVEYRSRDGQDIKLNIDVVKRYLVRGKPEFVTGQEFMFFMATCKAKGMNPFINDCYLIKYTQNDNAAIITSIDYYRKRAKSKEDCQGWKNGIVVKNLQDKIEYREGTLILDGETLLGGWFSALPKGWVEPQLWTVNLKGYIKKTREGNITKFWSEDNQPSQIAKVAESQGLRRIWSDEFQGLYLESEIQSRDAQDNLNEAAGMPKAEPGKVEYNIQTAPTGGEKGSNPDTSARENTATVSDDLTPGFFHGPGLRKPDYNAPEPVPVNSEVGSNLPDKQEAPVKEGQKETDQPDEETMAFISRALDMKLLVEKSDWEKIIHHFKELKDSDEHLEKVPLDRRDFFMKQCDLRRKAKEERDRKAAAVKK